VEATASLAADPVAHSTVVAVAARSEVARSVAAAHPIWTG
jgi:hypothetical protein